MGVHHARTRGRRLTLHLGGQLREGRERRRSCIYRHSRGAIGIPWLKSSRKGAAAGAWPILGLLRGGSVNIDRGDVVGRSIRSSGVIERHRLTLEVRIREA